METGGGSHQVGVQERRRGLRARLKFLKCLLTGAPGAAEEDGPRAPAVARPVFPDSDLHARVRRGLESVLADA